MKTEKPSGYIISFGNQHFHPFFYVVTIVTSSYASGRVAIMPTHQFRRISLVKTHSNNFELLPCSYRRNKPD